MYKKSNILLITSLIIVFLSSCNDQVKNYDNTKYATKKMNLKVILGSSRQGRTSEKIGGALKRILKQRTNINTEVVDLREYNLPFLHDEIMPAKRKTITDPATKRWSEKIEQADAFIVVVPEYNAGYPGVLKNALDILYKEWNNKPVGFVGYSGGPSGGSSVVAQLREVARALKMIPIEYHITIPSSWKALDAQGNFINMNIEEELNIMIDQLSRTVTTNIMS